MNKVLRVEDERSMAWTVPGAPWLNLVSFFEAFFWFFSFDGSNSSLSFSHRAVLVDTCQSPANAGLATYIEADCKVPGTEDLSRSLREAVKSVQDSM